MKKIISLTLLFFLAIGVQAQDKNAAASERAYNAYKEGDYATALSIYKKFIDEGYQAEISFSTAISMLKFMDKNEEAIEMSSQAMEKFPESEMLLIQAINVRVIDPDYYEEAIQLLKKAISGDKENVNFYYLLSSMYYNMERSEEAKPYLDKALKIDPNAYSPNYLYGTIYFEQGTDLAIKMNNVAISEHALYDKYKEDMTKLYNKSLPYFLNAHEAQPDETLPLEALMHIYMNVSEFEKFQEMKAKYNKLKAN